jgi:outer membrane protein OmpA-like peptidoglycan-associated protein/opacity protein-like surface antigen
MRLRKALITAAVLAVPVAAKAQPIAGPYVSLGAGMNFLQDELIKPVQVAGVTVPKAKVDFLQPGLGSEASVGFGLGNGLRLEAEGFYNYNHVHKIEGTRFPTLASGENEEYGGMLNALYDFDIGMPFVFPYVGVGVGYQWTTWHNVHGYTPGNELAARVDDTRGSFAYQGIAGLSFPVAGFPGLSLTAEYRLIGTPDNDLNFRGTGTLRAPDGALRASLPIRIAMHNEFAHQALFGVRYAFGVAPPPPPPPPPIVTPTPAPTRTYLVFFDWDRADLTARARQIVAEAAEASRHVAYTRIEVNGYTDRSGTPQYNIRLSIRRARAVEAELVRDGVPRNAIDIHGFGETHPLVPTAPGVREPQNRRVEIILR